MSEDMDPNGDRSTKTQLICEEQAPSPEMYEPPLTSSVLDNGEIMRMLSVVSQIAVEFSNLNKTIEKRITYDETKEKAFERLYIELDELKNNSTFEQLRPLYIDLILFFDRIENLKINENISLGVPDASELLDTLSEELLEILCRRDIELIKNSSLIFDPSVQLAISVQQTAINDENNTVARVVRRGFKYRNRLLRPEEVIVKKYSQ